MVIGFLIIALIIAWFWVMLVQPIMQAQHSKAMQEQNRQWKEKQEQEKLQRMSQTHSENLNQPKKLTPTQKENLEYMELILDCLAAFYEDSDGMTCTQIQKSIPEFERFDFKKVSALIGSLVKAGKVVKFVDKGRCFFKSDYSQLTVGEIEERKARFERRKIEYEKQQWQREREEQKEREKQEKIMASGIVAVDKMEGHQFEHYCADLLRKLSFSDVEVTKGSGDQGVDIIAVKDGIRYAIQCKCYSSSLGNSPVQEVNAGKQMYHCHVAVVLTNQYFTSGAKELAAATGVLLWDRDKLARMINQAVQSQE